MTAAESTTATPRAAKMTRDRTGTATVIVFEGTLPYARIRATLPEVNTILLLRRLLQAPSVRPISREAFSRKGAGAHPSRYPKVGQICQGIQRLRSLRYRPRKRFKFPCSVHSTRQPSPLLRNRWPHRPAPRKRRPLPIEQTYQTR